MAVGFSSCNKDKKVDIAYNVNVEVDPSTVMENFKEHYEGDFDLIVGDVLRIQLFIYDEQGFLVEKLTKECKGYNDRVNFSTMLPEGNYTFIASSDVYTPSSDFEMWIYSNTDRINTFRIDYCGYIRYDDIILGLRLYKKNIAGAENLSISLKPAVALLEFVWNSVHYFNDVIQYEFIFNNKKYDIVKTDGDTFEYSAGETGYYYTLSRINPDNFSSSNSVYGFTAILPISNVEYSVRGWISDTEYVPFGEGVTDFVAGEQYRIDVMIPDLDVEINKTSKSAGKSDACAVQSAKVMDLFKSNNSLIQSEVK